MFTFWRNYLLKLGKSKSIYLDKPRTHYNNHPSGKDDEEMLSQFQRAMKEIGIELIVAHSPQAKDKVERLFGTLQDRLIKEMRLEKISDQEKANIFLEKKFLVWFNSKYSKAPRKKANIHQKLTQQESLTFLNLFDKNIFLENVL